MRLITEGADVGQIAEATLHAAQKALASAQQDSGFREVMHFITELALTGSKPDPAAHLAGIGISLSENTSLAEVLVSVNSELDRRIDAQRQRSDFGEIAGKALVDAMTRQLRERFDTFFQVTRTDMLATFKEFGGRKQFGGFTRAFFSRFVNESLGYFLSKTLGTHLGEGQAFATTNQLALFERAMATHCEEASAIVEAFGGEWFVKHRREEHNAISRESAEGFGWKALDKLRVELALRAEKTDD